MKEQLSTRVRQRAAHEAWEDAKAELERRLVANATPREVSKARLHVGATAREAHRLGAIILDEMYGEDASKREALVKVAPDVIEGFSGKGVRIHIQRVPAALRAGESMADDVFHGLLPDRFKVVHAAECLQAVEANRPLKPSTLLASRETEKTLARLDAIEAEWGAT